MCLATLHDNNKRVLKNITRQLQYCRVIYHRCYIYIFSLNCFGIVVFSFQFCRFHYCGKPCAKNGLIWSTLCFGFSSYVVWSTGGSVLLPGTKSFPISSKNCYMEPSVFWKRLIFCHCCLSQYIIMSFGLFLSSPDRSSFFKETSSIIIFFLPYATTFYSHQLYKVRSI